MSDHHQDHSQAPDEVIVVLPALDDGQIAEDLRHLTEHLMRVAGADTSGGLLGGEYGYGAEFSNQVFEMHPYYWGECVCGHEEADSTWRDTHDHTPNCYQQVIRARGWLDWDSEVPLVERDRHNSAITDQVCAEMGLDPHFGVAVHCTCTHEADYQNWLTANPHDRVCGIVRPNFRHHATGTEVRWYKWIGRSMEVDVRGDWSMIVAECLASASPAAGSTAGAGTVANPGQRHLRVVRDQ